MATIICRQLAFGYDGTESDVFEDLDLVIDTGWRTALAGRNGRGKTTLLRLIHGDLAPDRGTIERGAATSYFPPSVDDPSLPARHAAKDAVAPYRRWEAEMESLLADGGDAALARYGERLAAYQEAGGYVVDARIETELAALDIAEALWRRPFATLSGGEQTRCLLAGLFARPRGYPLIDEPTNHLDGAGRRLLARYLRAKAGFLLVSHDRAFLDACCDHVVALNPDTVEVRRTSFSAWRARFRQRLARQRARNAELKRDIAALADTARDRRAGAHKREGEKAAHADKGFIGNRAKRQMKKALIAEKRATAAAAERRETLADVEKERQLKLNTSPAPAGNLLVVNDLALRRGGRRLFAHLSFTVAAGDRVAVIGPNGSGKTSLLDQIEQPRRHRQAGALARPGHIRVARAFQHPLWASGSLRERLRDGGFDEGRFRQVMAVLGVRGSVLDNPIEELSQGQRKKIDLARTFLAEAHLLLWDEPLNFVDIDARERLEEVLLRDAPTVVFVEHDAAFVERVATQVVELVPG